MKDSIFMKKIVFNFLVAFASVCFFSCVSTKVEVPDNASSLEIIQLAQTALDKGSTKKSLQYYEILLQRYGMNTAIYIEGRYEIAHIYVKQKKTTPQPVYQQPVARPQKEEP